MAEVKPLPALHYNLERGPVAGGRHRAALRRDRRRSSAPSCSPARPSTWSRSTCREAPAGRRSLRARRRDARGMDAPGHPGRRPRARDLGADPGLHGPRRQPPHPPRLPRPGAGHRLRPGPGPPPRAHPARPEGGPPAADPGHPPQPLADLRPAPRRRLAPARARDLAATSPGARSPTPTAPSTASGGSPTRRSTRPSPPSLADAELLIADGHHRYETARAYADEIGGEGAAPLHADVPGLARRPRPHGLPHPPPARATSTRDAQRARSATALRELFDVEEVAERPARPGRRGGRRRLRLHRLPLTAAPSACGSRTPAALDAALAGQLRGLPPARRRDPRDAGPARRRSG